MITLRNYQLEAVNNIRNSYKRGNKAPLLVLPTGGGKTVIFSHIAAETSKKNKRVLILMHRIELLRQTASALEKSGVQYGLINPKFTSNLMANVQVASVQTLVNRLHKHHFKYDLIITDECHHAISNSYRKIIDHFSEARQLGVTATPIRSDGEALGEIYDDLIHGPQIYELIKMGFLAKPVVYAPEHKIDLSGIRTKMGDFDKEQLAERIDKPHITGSAVAHYTRHCPGEPAVVFCVSVLHAQHVAEEFRKAGYSSYSVDGSMEDEQRKRILNGLATGHVQVVTSCDLISEGTDIPAIACAILLRATQSTGLYLQQVGRALRVIEGKKRAVILDHVGNVVRHGSPEAHRDWSLEGEVKKKRKKNTEPTIPTRQCEKCYCVHAPLPACPSCGHIYELKSNAPDEIEGELIELTPEILEAMKQKKKSEVGRARTLEELEKIAQIRGYKSGWAKHLYNSRQKNSVA